MKSFASDNYAGVLPEVMAALAAANVEHARSYGADDISERTINLFKDTFGDVADVLFVFNGTGANVLSISAATQSFHAVLPREIRTIAPCSDYPPRNCRPCLRGPWCSSPGHTSAQRPMRGFACGPVAGLTRPPNPPM